MTFDLLLAASPGSPRLHSIANSLAHCADGFLGALLHDWAQIDPAGDVADEADESLTRVLAAQMNLQDAPSRAVAPALFATSQTQHAHR